MPDTVTCINAVKKLYDHFTETNIILEKQRSSLQKIIDLFKEDEAKTTIPGATKSRHNAARSLLRNILGTLGDEVFFLCAFALPITWLATIKAQDTFVKELRSWWSIAKHPTHLSQHIPRLKKQLPSTVQSTESHKSEHEPSDSSTAADQPLRPIPNEPVAMRDSGAHGGQASEPSSCVDRPGNPVLAVDIASKGNEDDEDSEDGDETEEIEAAQQPDQLEASMDGKVYELSPMDVVRVVSLNNATPILTVPHYQGIQPFITIRVPEKLAMQMMTRRKQLM